MKLDIDYELTGDVNNAMIHVVGKGVADFSEGQYKMDLKLLRVPMHWDPGFLILICCDRITGACAKEVGNALNIFSLSDGDYSLSWRGAYLYDDKGRPAGHVSASSYGSRKGNVLISRSQVMGGYVHLNLMEEIVEIRTPYHGVMMPFGKDISLLTTGYSFRTNQSNDYWGYTTYPYRTPNSKTIAQPQLLTVEKASIERSTSNAGEKTMHIEIGQIVQSLRPNTS